MSDDNVELISKEEFKKHKEKLLKSEMEKYEAWVLKEVEKLLKRFNDNVHEQGKDEHRIGMPQILVHRLSLEPYKKEIIGELNRVCVEKGWKLDITECEPYLVCRLY